MCCCEENEDFKKFEIARKQLGVRLLWRNLKDWKKQMGFGGIMFVWEERKLGF